MKTTGIRTAAGLAAGVLALTMLWPPLSASGPSDTDEASTVNAAGAPAKIRGLVFTGPHSPPLDEATFTSMREVGATHVALVPEGTVDPDTLAIRHSFEGQWYGETREATVEGIRRARAAGLRVMIKPHLAIARGRLDRSGRGIWRGDFDVRTEAEWPRFAASYREFLLPYARLAEQEGVDLLCLGTELKRLALGRPEFWRELTAEVRELYGGELTYAANWDSFDRIEFWDALDLIGVDAYFPVSDAQVPQTAELTAGWQPWLERLGAVHERFDRPVLFTEWGYEREDHPAREPWVIGGGGFSITAEAAQANAYEGTFRNVWDAPWMRGIFVWRWAPRLGGEPGAYSPRGTKAEEVLRRWFTGRPAQ